MIEAIESVIIRSIEGRCPFIDGCPERRFQKKENPKYFALIFNPEYCSPRDDNGFNQCRAYLEVRRTKKFPEKLR